MAIVDYTLTKKESLKNFWRHELSVIAKEIIELKYSYSILNSLDASEFDNLCHAKIIHIKMLKIKTNESVDVREKCFTCSKGL